MTLASIGICVAIGVWAFRDLLRPEYRSLTLFRLLAIRDSAQNLITLVDSWGGWDITKISELRAALEKLRAALEGK